MYTAFNTNANIPLNIWQEINKQLAALKQDIGKF